MIHNPPNRVTDLIALKKGGTIVDCQTFFEVVPVDFTHRNNAFQAYVFLCRYTGQVDSKEFTFRKCYARGCPHNLCPHVSQAIMIANRYLQKDYRLMEQAGLKIDQRLFTLEDMLVKFDGVAETYGSVLTIHDYINIAKEGNPVSLDITLEYVPAVEHFAHEKNSQTFLMVDFSVTCLGETCQCERCLACYATDMEKQEKQQKIKVANDRLNLLYSEFDQAVIKYEKRLFE